MNNIGSKELELLKEKYQGENLDIALNKIKNGYPVQYLIGNVNFYGNEIKVSEGVLIPRYETEFLVDLVIKTLGKDYEGNIIDIGTGTGCIAISIGKTLNNSKIIGIDINKKALELAKENIIENNVKNVELKELDIFSVKDFQNYNVIISNPPYVSENEEVGIEIKYEPQNAIFASNNGLIFYEEIIKKASLTNNISHIFFEIGMNQGESITEYKNKYLPDYEIRIIKDLANKDRYIHIFMNK